MATFTININELQQLFTGITIVDDCLDLSGTNTKIYYSSTPDIVNGTILYSDEAKTTLFVGNNLKYRGAFSIVEGVIDLNTVVISTNTFDVNNSGVVSNSILC